MAFVKQKDQYAQERALVFRNVDYIFITVNLLRKKLPPSGEVFDSHRRSGQHDPRRKGRDAAQSNSPILSPRGEESPLIVKMDLLFDYPWFLGLIYTNISLGQVHVR